MISMVLLNLDYATKYLCLIDCHNLKIVSIEYAFIYMCGLCTYVDEEMVSNFLRFENN